MNVDGVTLVGNTMRRTTASQAFGFIAIAAEIMLKAVESGQETIITVHEGSRVSGIDADGWELREPDGSHEFHVVVAPLEADPDRGDLQEYHRYKFRDLCKNGLVCGLLFPFGNS